MWKNHVESLEKEGLAEYKRLLSYVQIIGKRVITRVIQWDFNSFQ